MINQENNKNQSQFISKWEKYTINLNEETNMTLPLLQYAINQFKTNISSQLLENQYYHCQLQCSFHVIDEQIHMDYYINRSISYLQFFMKDGPKESSMLEIFWHFWSTFYEERYKLFLVKSISIQYKTLSPEYNSIIVVEDVQNNIKPKPLSERINNVVGLGPEVEELNISQINPQKILKYKNYSGYNLPLTMDITKWGYTIFNAEYNLATCWLYNINNIQISNIKTVPIIYDSKSIKLPLYQIELTENQIKTIIKIKENELFSFEDTLLTNTHLSNYQSLIQNLDNLDNLDNLNNFVRTINNTKYYYINGKEEFMIKEKKVKFIPSKKNKDSFKGTNFITMDLETKTIDGVLTPYCVSIFNGKNVTTFYITDFKDSNELLINSIKSLMQKEYNGYKVFLHNFSYFDGIFLLSIITSLSNDVKILMRNSRIIDVKLGFGKNKIYFRDSLLMIPIGLAKAAKGFGVEDKGIFPYKFVNQPEIKYDYIGPVPDYDFFEKDKVTESTYQEYCKEYNNDWNLEKETIKYCEQDCIVLYQILQKFSSFIYDEFKINFLNSPTLSSLAFLIYRTNFMEDLKDKLPIITGKTYKDIKKSYSGGAVDVYLPYGENLYLYDINSLYPSVMREYPMPVGQPKYFEGNILENLKLLENNDLPFGFFEVEITTPDNILNPILQTKLSGLRGGRTIAPIGTWIGWYFSEELYNAEKYGYKFKVLKGYLFKKADIFSEYVKHFYDMKLNSPKNSANYTISKLLLNSLYGKLGMNPEKNEHMLIDSNNKDYYTHFYKSTITFVIDFGNGKELIKFKRNSDIKGNINSDNNQFWFKSKKK